MNGARASIWLFAFLRFIATNHDKRPLSRKYIAIYFDVYERLLNKYLILIAAN